MDDKPVLSVVQAEVLESFWYLNHRRPIFGLGYPGAIPLPEIESYCSIYNIVDRAEFADLISMIDVKFLELMAKKQDTK